MIVLCVHSQLKEIIRRSRGTFPFQRILKVSLQGLGFPSQKPLQDITIPDQSPAIVIKEHPVHPIFEICVSLTRLLAISAPSTFRISTSFPPIALINAAYWV